jgi:hypothetical protein
MSGQCRHWNCRQLAVGAGGQWSANQVSTGLVRIGRMMRGDAAVSNSPPVHSQE